MPSSCAFASLDPAASPAITRSVFFDTLPATFAPSATRRALASSRDSWLRLPVRTTVLPANGLSISSAFTTTGAGQRTPSASSCAMTSRLLSSAKKLKVWVATTMPTSGTFCSSSMVACSRASRVPKCAARPAAVASPTSRIPKA